jgi:hypothetical protein
MNEDVFLNDFWFLSPRFSPRPFPVRNSQTDFGFLATRKGSPDFRVAPTEHEKNHRKFAIMDPDGDVPKKAHHKSKTGRKAEKKKEMLTKKKGMTVDERLKQRNPKVLFTSLSFPIHFYRFQPILRCQKPSANCCCGGNLFAVNILPRECGFSFICVIIPVRNVACRTRKCSVASAEIFTEALGAFFSKFSTRCFSPLFQCQLA